MRVLLVDDDARLTELLVRGLRRRGFAVDAAPDGQAALDHTACTPYDVVVLDRDLPVVDGDEVCRRLDRAGRATKVLMLTASGGLADRVAGLELGADDYLGKPFAFDELVARIRALGRRTGPYRPPVLAWRDVVLDRNRREVTRGGHPVALAAKELAVLEVLMAAAGAVVSAEELLERVWDEHANPFTTSVKVTVHRLRRKLGEPGVISTVDRAGYRMS